MKMPTSVKSLDDFGRIQLSKTFFMRDFLYSEISNFDQIANIPENPQIAVEVGKAICTELLEPLQDQFGRLAIRSAYRSKAVNGHGNAMQKARKAGYNCASNESNYGGHIWDVRDSNGHLGATVCLVVPSFISLYNSGTSWTELALWIHDNLPYSSMCFFPKNAAFNLTWSESPKRTIRSYVKPTKISDIDGVNLDTKSHSKLYPNISHFLSWN